MVFLACSEVGLLEEDDGRKVDLAARMDEKTEFIAQTKDQTTQTTWLVGSRGTGTQVRSLAGASVGLEHSEFFFPAKQKNLNKKTEQASTRSHTLTHTRAHSLSALSL
jgi:hypothetical protein